MAQVEFANSHIRSFAAFAVIDAGRLVAFAAYVRFVILARRIKPVSSIAV